MDKTTIENLGQLSQQFINSLVAPPEHSSLNPDIKQLFDMAIQKPYRTTPYSTVVSYSMAKDPMDLTPGRLSGYSRNWGHASSTTQQSVMQKILNHSSDLSTEDQAILLGIARIESGFNPDAATPSSSAAGVFQIVNSTGNGLGLPRSERFDADANIKAGIKLYKSHLAIVNQQWPNLSGNERAKMLYALHHDGPSLQYGGAKIATEKLLPFLTQFRQVASVFKTG